MTEPLIPGSKPWMEAQIGEVTAIVAALMIHGRNEVIRTGQTSDETRRMGKQMIACLVEWKLDPRLADFDFDAVVKRTAPPLLHGMCPTLEDTAIQSLIGDVLKIVKDVMKRTMN